jgi:hypothetical protein
MVWTEVLAVRYWFLHLTRAGNEPIHNTISCITVPILDVLYLRMPIFQYTDTNHARHILRLVINTTLLGMHPNLLVKELVSRDGYFFEGL